MRSSGGTSSSRRWMGSGEGERARVLHLPPGHPVPASRARHGDLHKLLVADEQVERKRIMPVNISQRDKVLEHVSDHVRDRLSAISNRKPNNDIEYVIAVSACSELMQLQAWLEEELKKPLEINKETVHER